MLLTEYAQKRDFRKTPEPENKRTSKGEAQCRFVIQKHDATRLHYDFRLEMGGALKSWAIPKGIPYSKGEKRLAVQVEDHPVSYINFEGTIPKGQYGGGTVMLWDHGTYTPLTSTPAKDLHSGKLHFLLHGKKLEGEWYLVRLQDKGQWLLIRGGENARPVSKKNDDTSVATGRSMAEIGLGEDENHADAGSGGKKSPRQLKTSIRKTTSETPKFIEPMKALQVSSVPAGDWVYEIKFDGFRALGLLGANDAKLFSRTNHDLGAKFPEIVESLKTLNEPDTIVDGEIVALDKKGVSSFQLLQAYEMGQERPPIYFYVFDLLRLKGKDLRELPLIERKNRLKKWLGKTKGVVRFSDVLGDDADKLLPHARKMGIEGLIGKRKISVYETGRRSGAWIKLKFQQEQEFVIGGYTDPKGSRSYLGALLIGYYQGKRFLYAGKVGSGFDQARLRNIHTQLQPLYQQDCPFDNLPEPKRSRYGQAITSAEMKRCHWVKPEAVCQLKFREWTRDGRLRQPVFIGMREDKIAREVVREGEAA